MPTIRTSSSTLYDSHELIASRNALRLDHAKQQYVRCVNDGRFNVLDSITNFCVSMKINVEDFHASSNGRVCLISTINYPGNFYGFAAFINNGTEIMLVYAQNSSGADNMKTIRYPIPIENFTNQIIQITISQDVTHKQMVSAQSVVVPTVYFNGRSLKVDLASSNISGVYDDAISCLNNQPYVEVGRLAVRDITFVDYTKGCISDLLILNSQIEVQSVCSLLQGVVPPELHPNAVAYVSFNQDSGLVAFDTVEQFNYAKLVPIQSGDWELVNFSSDDVGVTNIQSQSAWYNIYTRQPETLHVNRKGLRFDSSLHQYLTVPNFNPTKELGYTTIVGFALDANRSFDNNYGDTLLSKRDSVNGKYKLITGVPGTEKILNLLSVPSGFGSNMVADLNTDLSKVNFVVFQESDHVDSSSIFYNSYVNRKSFCNGFDVGRIFNGYNRSHGYDEIDGDLYIGVDDLETVAGRYFNGYLFYVGLWKGMLSEVRIHNLINKGFPAIPSVNEMEDCVLFVDFNSAYDDGGVLKLVDLSAGGHKIVMNNYVALDIDASVFPFL